MNNKSWAEETTELMQAAERAANNQDWKECSYYLAKLTKLQAERLLSLDIANKNYRDIVLKAYRRRATDPDHYDQEHLLDRRY
jgi:hypothetical protein